MRPPTISSTSPDAIRSTRTPRTRAPRRASRDPRQQRGVLGPQLLVGRDPQRDAADLGLVVDVVGLDLQRDRIADLVGQRQRLIDALGQATGRNRDAVEPEQFLAGRLRDTAAAGVGQQRERPRPALGVDGDAALAPRRARRQRA